jgi:hypothetical protein
LGGRLGRASGRLGRAEPPSPPGSHPAVEPPSPPEPSLAAEPPSPARVPRCELADHGPACRSEFLTGSTASPLGRPSQSIRTAPWL